MNYSMPASLTVVKKDVMDAVTGDGIIQAPPSKRLRAVWVQASGTEFDLGRIAGFTGGTSFSGTNGSLTIAWPDEKNPRTTGDWWQMLVPDDGARLKISLVVKTRNGDVEIPLLTGVPSPDGVNEIYGRKKEIVEIKIEDVTGPASRIKNYSVPMISGDTIDPRILVSAALGSIEYECMYSLVPVDACVSEFANALAAADDALITQQDNLNPLTGQKRVRYGDRDGRIIYRILEDPDSGQPFTGNFPASDYDFAYTGKKFLNGLSLEPYYARFSVSAVNPYMDIASRLKLQYSRAGLDEIVEIHGMNWRIMPRGDVFKVKARREYTL